MATPVNLEELNRLLTEKAEAIQQFNSVVPEVPLDQLSKPELIDLANQYH